MFEVLGLAMANPSLEQEEPSEISSTNESKIIEDAEIVEPEVEVVEPSEVKSESDPWN